MSTPPEALPRSAETVVVGSGPGGAVTACLLAEAGREVLLLEEGPEIPLEACRPYSRQEMRLKYRHGGITAALGSPRVAYVEARCVGGGSEVNSGLYHRTPPEVLQEWRDAFAVDALGEEDLRPHFEACERDLAVADPAPPWPGPSARLEAGARALGWSSVEVPRWISDGTRRSMSRSYLPRFRSAGGRVAAGTRVEGIERRRDGWRLRAVRDGRPVDLGAATVFLAAGAVQTPFLLRRSGLSSGAGRTFHLHPTVKAVARFPAPVNGPEAGVAARQIKHFSPRLGFGCSVSSPPHLALALVDHPEALAALERTWTSMAMFYAMSRGGRGRVRPVAFRRHPRVEFRMSTAEMAEMAEALRLLARCLFAAGAEEVYPALPGLAALRSPDEVDRLPAALDAATASLMSVHLFSSCPMGESPEAVVDSFGRLRHAPGLHVADASLLCGPPGVNPQGTIMALARRNALRFLGRA